MSSPSTKSVEHPVKSGETLAGIARQHGVTLEALLAANPEIQDPNRKPTQYIAGARFKA